MNGFDRSAFEAAQTESAIKVEKCYPGCSTDPPTLNRATDDAEGWVVKMLDARWRQEKICNCCRRAVHTGELGDVVLNLSSAIAAAKSTAGTAKQTLIGLICDAELFYDQNSDRLTEITAALEAELGGLGQAKLEWRAAEQAHHRCDVRAQTELYDAVL